MDTEKTIHVIEVGDQFAVIDREQGTISIMDKENLDKYYSGEEYECITTKMTISARSGFGGWGDWQPGDGRPPWAGGGGRREMDMEEL